MSVNHFISCPLCTYAHVIVDIHILFYVAGGLLQVMSLIIPSLRFKFTFAQIIHCHMDHHYQRKVKSNLLTLTKLAETMLNPLAEFGTYSLKMYLRV